MTRDDQIQDYVEYLVQNKDIRSLEDLLPHQRNKLLLLILINNGAYVKLIKLMHKLLKEESERHEKSESTYRQTKKLWR